MSLQLISWWPWNHFVLVRQQPQLAHQLTVGVVWYEFLTLDVQQHKQPCCCCLYLVCCCCSYDCPQAPCLSLPQQPTVLPQTLPVLQGPANICKTTYAARTAIFFLCMSSAQTGSQTVGQLLFCCPHGKGAFGLSDDACPWQSSPTHAGTSQMHHVLGFLFKILT